MIPGGIKIRLLLEAKYGDDPLLDPVPWYLLKPRLFFIYFRISGQIPLYTKLAMTTRLEME